MSRIAKLITARIHARRALKRVQAAEEHFARDYAAFSSVRRDGLNKFERVRARLAAALDTVDREIAAIDHPAQAPEPPKRK